MSIFQNVPRARVPRSSFDLSHSRKLSMTLGQLVPVLVQEVVPGDKFNINTESMVRLAPMVAPVMHRMNATIHYFFVPTRLLMEKWDEFITGQSGTTVPLGDLADVKVGSLADHMGLPPGEFAGMVPVNMLPFRAYMKIWNDYYRDGNLQETEYDILSGANDNAMLGMDCKIRAWEKDYFTSALPQPQKGEPVTINGTITYMPASVVKRADGSTPSSGLHLLNSATGPASGGKYVSDTAANVRIENVDAISIEVEQLRLATRLQRWLERNMRAGTRYAEHLLSNWNIKSKDSRLQRAEYIGGGRTPIVISEVPNTTGTVDAPQGTLAGNGISIGSSNTASKFCEEHGYIIGIMSVLPETSYFQGMPRMYNRKLNLDFYYPEFAQLGEQEVKNGEIFLTDNNIDNEGTFGYQSRFAEYKYNPNTVHGEFRNTLEFWHMGRKFDEAPLLNEEFITADKIQDETSPTGPWRIFAVNSSEQLYVQLWHNIRATRPMPFLNDPTL